jgi:Flp pilus assembly protein CpaB
VGSKRSMILIVALLVGGIAAFSLYKYVSGVEDKALSNTETVKVWTVAEDLPANTVGDQAVAAKLIVSKLVPAYVRPPSAVTDLTTIQGKVAKTDLKLGQILVPGMFVDPSEASSTWAERLPVDRVAVQVSLDQTRGLVGMLQPGDKVTALIMGKCPDPPDGDDAESKARAKAAKDCKWLNPNGLVSFLYSNLEVLNIGTGATPSTTDASGKTVAATSSPIITFSVPLDAARRLVQARELLYLTLEPKDFVPPADSSNKVTGDPSTQHGGPTMPFPSNFSPYKG